MAWLTPRRVKVLAAGISSAFALAGGVYALGAHAAEQEARLRRTDEAVADIKNDRDSVGRIMLRVERRLTRLEVMVEAVMAREGMRPPARTDDGKEEH